MNTETQKGRKKPFVNGFSYTLERVYGGKFYWRCAQRSCKGRVHSADENGPYVDVSGHCHAADPVGASVNNAVTEMKHLAAETQHPTAMVQLMGEQQVTEAEGVHFPAKAALHKMIRRKRKQTQGFLPQPIDLNTLVIPPHVTQILGVPPESCLLYDSGANGNERTLIFGTRKTLDMLQNSEHWFSDGTFKVAPPLFQQVYSLHVLQNNEVLVAAFALVCRKDQATYVNVLRQLKALRPLLNPRSILTDFEQASIQAFRDEFPLAENKGCYFHLCQSVYRKVQEVGLQATYLNDAEFALHVRMLPSLAFVPPADVAIAFNALITNNDFPLGPNNAMQLVVDYFERVYVGRPVVGGGRAAPLFPVELWNMHGRTVAGMPKTNNSVEGHHHRISCNMGTNHPSVYKYIDVIKKELVLSSHDYERVLNGQVVSRKSAKYGTLKEHVLAAVAVYPTVTHYRYLRRIAYLFSMCMFFKPHTS